MKKHLILMSLAGALSLQASYVIKPSKIIDAYDDSFNKPAVKLSLLKRIDPTDSFKWQFARYYEGEHLNDLYFRDLNAFKDKLIAAGSYHSSVFVANTKTDEVTYNEFHSIKDADHGKLGVKYAEAEQDANKSDEWSGASELFVEQTQFIDAKTALVNAMPKYLGVDNPDAKPYLHQAGIHKVELDKDGKIVKTLAFAQGEFFLFRPYKNGLIAMGLDSNFSVFDKNLKLIKNFQIKNAVKADVAKDRLFVMLKGDEKGIYEYDLKKNKLKKISDFEGQYFGRPIKATTSPFLLTHDAKSIIYATPDTFNSQLCKLTISSGKTECSNAELPLYGGSYALSPNNKYLAYTMGSNRGQTSVYNVEDKPYLAGYAKGGVTSYAAAWLNNEELAVSDDAYKIDIFKVEKSGKINAIDRFEDLKSRFFDFVAKDMKAIKFKVKEAHGKKKIKTDLFLPNHILGVNVTWVLPDEFKQFVNEKGKIIALPAKDYSGQITAILKLVENGKTLREEAISSDFKLKVKRSH